MRFNRQIILALVIMFIGVLAYFLGWSKVFVVKNIEFNIEDNKISAQIFDKLSLAPAVVKTGDQIARVDRGEIATRLRQFPWVENVELDRNLLNGKLTIKIIARSPVARLTSTSSSLSQSIGFMGSDLDYFYLTRQAIDQAISSGDKSWQEIPELTLPAPLVDGSQRELKAGARDLITLFNKELSGKGFTLTAVTARDESSFISKTKFLERNVEISWGNLDNLGLKVEVLERLLALKENKRVRQINLIDPLKPTVR